LLKWTRDSLISADYIQTIYTVAILVKVDEGFPENNLRYVLAYLCVAILVKVDWGFPSTHNWVLVEKR
jgi:hypothetical protein